MDEQQEEVKDKLTRSELLAKARAIKAEKAKLKRVETKNNNLDIIEFDEVEEKPKPTPTPKPKAKPTPKPKAKKEAKPKAKVEITELKPSSQSETKREPEIVEEVIRVPANRHKKIIKRTIELEESETDEEIVEEIVKVPKMKKEVKISRDEMKKKLIEANKNRLYNELFS